MKDWIKALDSRSFGSGTYSQSYQDELIDIVFSNIRPRNPAPYCIEFGFNSDSLTTGTGANVSTLVLSHDWDCLLLDGDHENPDINLHRHFLTPDNITGVFRRHGVPEEPEYVSIDVDSTDLWLFEAVVREYRAMLFSVEYNSNFPLAAAVTFPNDPRERWERDKGYGASLKALNMVAEKYGYALLWVVPRLDAFFIRNDLIDDGTDEICFPFDKWKKVTELPCHPPLRKRRRADIFIDYEAYIATGGDIGTSRRRAHAVCKKYLTNEYSAETLLNLSKLIAKNMMGILKNPFIQCKNSAGDTENSRAD